ncbi:hypothetical protein [Phaeobacter sp. BS23]
MPRGRAARQCACVGPFADQGDWVVAETLEFFNDPATGIACGA